MFVVLSEGIGWDLDHVRLNLKTRFTCQTFTLNVSRRKSIKATFELLHYAGEQPGGVLLPPSGGKNRSCGSTDTDELYKLVQNRDF